MADVNVSASSIHPLLRASAALALAGAVFMLTPGVAVAFPPYRSTDGAPATPYELGVRLGLGKFQRDDGRSAVTAPLLRTSLGLPHGFEAIGQLEYSPRAGSLADGAVGGKWATRINPDMSVGVETMALLPVRPSSEGIGVESLLAATVRSGAYRLHLNAGGFHDPRNSPAQSGWRASALAEVDIGRDRFGLEMFGRDSNRGGADLRIGAGVIRNLGRFDLRTAVHVGLSDAAPDVVTTLWLTTTFPPRR
jgi:hypothetical protein